MQYRVILSKKNAITIFIIRYFENDTILGITIYHQTICSSLVETYFNRNYKIVKGTTWLMIFHHKLPGKILDLGDCDQTKPKIKMIFMHEDEEPHSITARI